MDRRYDMVMAGVFVALGVFLLVYAANYPEPKVRFDDIGPMGFPIFLGLFFIGGGTLQLVRDVKVLQTVGRFGVDEGKGDDEESLPASFAQASKIMVGALLYLPLMQLIGYLAATPIVMWIGLRFMKTPLRRAVLVSVVFTVVGFLLFDAALGVELPRGRVVGWIGFASNAARVGGVG